MARKKTPNRSSKTDGPNEPTDAAQTDDATPEGGEVVSVTDADTQGGDSDTVEAEIVSEPGPQDRVGDDTVSAEGIEPRPAGEDEVIVTASDDADGTDTAQADEPKKKRGFPFGAIAALLLLGVVGWLVYSLIDDDDEVQVAEDETPGLVVSEAEPFPGNELDEPIRAEAAPGTRAAAREADRAVVAEEPATRDVQARRMDQIGDDAEDDTVQAEAEAASARVSALRARAAERRAQREAGEAEADNAAGGTPFYVADADEAQPPVAQERDEDGSVARDRDDDVAQDRTAQTRGADDMAARVAAARAAQDRVRREDETRLRDRTQEARERPVPTTRDRDDETVARDRNPNALPQFTEDEPAPTTEVFGRNEEERDRAPIAAERDMRNDEGQTVRRTTRPTGRVAPLGGTAPADEFGEDTATDDRERDARRAFGTEDDARDPFADPEAEERAARRAADLVRERMNAERRAEPRARTLPDEAATEEELDERLSEVRADLREDVLAETEARIRTAIEETEREVENLREALTEQEERSDERITRLTDRLEVLQRRDASASQQGVLILALSNLAGTIDRGEPFERQLDDVERLAPNARSLRAARRYARDGLPTERVLSERFQDVARRALAAEGRADADGGLGGIWANLRGLFTVRRVGEVEGDTPSAIISRAEAALERDDLAAAVRELEGLDGPAEEAFEPWMADARAKADVTDRVNRLERAVLARDG